MERAEPARALDGKVATGPWWFQAVREYASSPLIRNATYLWVNTISLAAFGFVFWIAAARLYPADAVGYGASAVASITLVASVSHLGLGLGIIRFLPERRESSTGLVNSVFLVTVAASLLASSVFLLGLDLWAPSLNVVREHPVFFATFLVGGAAYSLSQVMDQVFVATRRAGFVLIKNLGLGMLRIALVVSLAAFFASFGIVAAHAVAGGLLVGVSVVVLLPAALKGYKAALEWKPREIRSMSSFAAGNHVGTLLLVAPGNIFTVIVLNAAGPEDAAYFYVAWTIGMFSSALAVAFATSLFAEGSHDPRQLRRHAMKALLAGTLPVILVTLTVMLGAGLILRVFGDDYASSGATLLRLLALASLPYFLVNVYISVARVEKNITAIVLVGGTMAGVSLAVGYPLVHSMGLQGIGIAWIAGQLIALVIAAVFFARGYLLPADGRHQSNKALRGVEDDASGGGP